MSAVEMVGRLLERYALSMDEIEVRASKCVQREVLRRRPIDGCVSAIARFCDCKVWLAPAVSDGEASPEEGAKPKRYIFFGFETDAGLATYLFAVIERAIATETHAFKLDIRACAPCGSARPRPASSMGWRPALRRA
jgi:hypothetical protein